LTGLLPFHAGCEDFFVVEVSGQYYCRQQRQLEPKDPQLQLWVFSFDLRRLPVLFVDFQRRSRFGRGEAPVLRGSKLKNRNFRDCLKTESL
jgi:hypothetical protein